VHDHALALSGKADRSGETGKARAYDMNYAGHHTIA
jgi:hypothetical protein